MSKQLTVIGIFVVLTFLGCGPSKKQEASKKQGTSIAEMKRVQAAFGDLQIAVDAGVLREEFSQRTNDTLVKIGDLKRSEDWPKAAFQQRVTRLRRFMVISTARLKPMRWRSNFSDQIRPLLATVMRTC